MTTRPEDTPTIARLCEEVATLTAQLERCHLVIEEQDTLRREECASLKEKLRETHTLFKAERAGLYRKLSIGADELDQLKREHRQEVIFLRGEFGEQIVSLETQLLHERSEREAAQRTIAILGGGLDPEPEELTCANEKCGKKSTKRRGNQLYCSDRCKLATQKRRARAKLAPCQNEKCSEKIEGKRKGARYCSAKCKNAAGVRRHRASIGGGES